MEMIPFFVKVGAVDAAVASLRDAADCLGSMCLPVHTRVL